MVVDAGGIDNVGMRVAESVEVRIKGLTDEDGVVVDEIEEMLLDIREGCGDVGEHFFSNTRVSNN